MPTEKSVKIDETIESEHRKTSITRKLTKKNLNEAPAVVDIEKEK